MSRIAASTGWQRTLTIAVVAATAFTMAACRSSGNSDTTTSPSTAPASGGGGASASTGGGGTTATGSDIKIGSIFPEGTAGQNDPAVESAMKASAADLNKSGGINGHKVVIDYCNAGSDPNTASACARKMVSDKVVGMVRDYAPVAPDQVTDVLKAASIPEIFSDPLSTSQYNSPNFFPIDGGSSFEIGAGIATAKASHFTKLSIVTLDAPATQNIIDVAQQAAKTAGIKIVNVTKIPVTATDMSSYAAKVVSSGAQGVFMGVFDSQTTSMISQMRQSGGTNIQVYLTDVEYTPSQYASLGASQANIHIVGPVPPVSAASKFPVLQQFVADMKTEQATGDGGAALDQQGTQSVEGWLGVQAIAKVLKGKTDVTAAGLTSALNATKGLDLGLFPAWTPSTPGPKGYTRVSNLNEYSSTIANGAPVLGSTTPTNIGPLLGFSS
jgi:ABC-type branched-subunit amino acid transport system substrate-binding protein